MFNRLKDLTRRFKKEITIYRLVLQDKRTPKMGKILLGAAVGYFFLPFDVIPDVIPVLGHLDDVIIIPLLIWAALKFIPKEIIEEHRKNLSSSLI